MRMVRSTAVSRNFWQVGRRSDWDHIFVVERQDLGGDTLNALVNHVETVLAGIDIGNDPVVDVDVGVLGPLDC